MKIISFLIVLAGLTASSLIGLRYWINQPDLVLFMDPVCSFKTNKKELILSFDDGPAPSTPALLALLEKRNVKAMFFVMGNRVEKYPEITKQTVDKGHIVANHSYKHNRMICRTYKYIEDDMLKTDSIIKSITHQPNNLYRPPYGQSLVNLPRVLVDHDKVMYNWSINAVAQYIFPLSKENIVNETVSQLHNGGIILLHDGLDYMPTEVLVEAVDEIITQARAMGYTFVLPQIQTPVKK